MWKVRKLSLRYVILCAAMAATLLSQMPALHGIRGYSAFYSALWMLLLVSSVLVRRQLYINRSFASIAVSLLIWASLMFLGMLTENKAYYSNETTTLLLSLFICLNGYFCADVIDQERLEKLFNIYIACTTVTAISVYITFFQEGFTWEYAMKNSFSPILLIAIILLVFFNWKRTTLLLRVLRLCLAALFLVGIFLIRSRATIVCACVVVVLTVFHRNIKRRYKFMLVTGVVAFVAAIFLSEDVFDLIVNQILLTGRDSLEVDSLSSGRADDIISNFYLFQENMLTGIGSMYLDCFYILSIYQYGIIGGCIVIGIALLPLVFVIKQGNKVPLYYKLIVIAFSINGLFEGLTPIGPGVKCMLLWLVYGVYMDTKASKGLLDK